MITKCKKCGSKDLYLEPRVTGQDVLTADMVALKCKDCGAWLKWCPKNERINYLKNQDNLGQNRTKQDKIGHDDKWQKLKEWLEEKKIISYGGSKEAYLDVLDKMRELEDEDE